VIVGDAKDPAVLKAAFKGATAVLEAIGGPDLLVLHKAMVDAAVEAKVPNFVGMGGAGTLAAYEGSGKEYHWEVLLERMGATADWIRVVSLKHIQNWKVLQATTGLNWTFVCPGKMDHGPATESNVTVDTQAGPQVSFESVAQWMVANLNLAGTKFNKHRVGLGTLL